MTNTFIYLAVIFLIIGLSYLLYQKIIKKKLKTEKNIELFDINSPDLKVDNKKDEINQMNEVFQLV